jgi:RimJ/RimL family protein N-acetyltransferase
MHPVVLEGNGVRLEPLRADHESAFRTAAADGRLWELPCTSVPDPEHTHDYIEAVLHECARGARLPFIVRELVSGLIVGFTTYHDIVPAVRRLEIGGTWYSKSWQRTHVNTASNSFSWNTHLRSWSVT